MEEQKKKLRGIKLPRLPRLPKPLSNFKQPRWLKPWPVYLGAIAVLGVTLYVVRHREAGTADAVLPASVQLKQNIEIQFGDVVMQGREKGIQRWVITAPKVSLSRDGRYTYFEPNPEGKFFNLKDWTSQDTTASAAPPPPGFPAPPGVPVPGASGVPTVPVAAASSPPGKTRSIKWKADKAQFDSFTEDLAIEGHAVITTDADDVIKTEKVEYSSRDKAVNLPKPVDIAMKNGTTIKADSLKANTGADVLEMQGHVDLTTKVNDQEKL